MAEVTEKTRRAFLLTAVKWGFGLLAALYGAVALRFLYPADIRKRSVRFEYLCKEEELPKQGVRKVNLSYESNRKKLTARIFVINHNSRIFALSAACSHLGCLVDWSRRKGQFVCPCHGGRYDIEGRVLEGPPPLPLAELPLRIEEGAVSVGLVV